MTVGVFDSGLGGLSVANAIKSALPGYEVLLREDKEHVPYGSKNPEELLGYVVPILQSMVDEGCEIIVIACNTVTTNLISELRDRFNVPLIGIEPMIKPASIITSSGVIAVCATPATLASKRYIWLKEKYAKNLKVLEPDCSDWSYMIENNLIDQQKIKSRINQVVEKGADVIVLGCTHYHWIEKEIANLVKDRAEVIQPEDAVIKQLW